LCYGEAARIFHGSFPLHHRDEAQTEGRNTVVARTIKITKIDAQKVELQAVDSGEL